MAMPLSSQGFLVSIWEGLRNPEELSLGREPVGFTVDKVLGSDDIP